MIFSKNLKRKGIYRIYLCQTILISEFAITNVILAFLSLHFIRIQGSCYKVHARLTIYHYFRKSIIVCYLIEGPVQYLITLACFYLYKMKFQRIRSLHRERAEPAQKEVVAARVNLPPEIHSPLREIPKISREKFINLHVLCFNEVLMLFNKDKLINLR